MNTHIDTKTRALKGWQWLVLVVIATVLASLLPLPVAANSPNWYNSSWLYRKRITFTTDSAKIPSTQTNFPVLISLTSDPDLAADALNNGDDILFTSSDGITKIPHEIEKFDGGTGELVAWVKVPSLSTSTVIFMYYGNSGASNQQDVASVWDSGFKGIWHLDETTGLTIYDSTSNANNGAPTDDGAIPPNSTVILDAAGKVNGADEFDGDFSHINVGDAASLDLSTEGTLEAWIKSDGFLGNDGIIHKGDETDFSDEAYSLQVGGALGTDVVVLLIQGSSTQQSLEGQTILSALTWYHIVAVWDANGMYIYINGTLNNSSGSTLTVRNTSGGVNIGSQVDLALDDPPTNLPFDGIIDEVRVSSTARTANWIKASYSNQSSPSTFYRLGAEQQEGGWDSYQDENVTTQSDTFSDYATQHTVYMYGTGFTPGFAYRVIFWDEVDGTWYNRATVDISATSDGKLGKPNETPSNLVIHTFAEGTDTDGDWHVAVYDSQSHSPSTYDLNDPYLVANDTSYTGGYAFHVEATAIPEFPSILAAVTVAGLCFGIYWWMRRKRMAYVEV